MLPPTVFFSDKAYLGILAETYEKIGTETGGIFLGKKDENNWYILETIDPGPNSIFQPAYFEYDTPYVTHLSNKISRLYKHGLELIGLWHRHPGNFSSFSSTDNGTNLRYAKLSTSGAISSLVNLVPDFQLKVFYVDVPLRYTEVEYKVGDQFIPTPIQELKSIDNFLLTRYDHAANHRRSQQYSTRQVNSLQLDSRSENDKGCLGKLIHGFQSIGYSNKVDKNTREAENVLSRKEMILDMIDGEIDYLEAQGDYFYTMKMQDEGVIIFMQYKHQMQEYPTKLEFVFGKKANEASGFVIVDRKRYRYHPQFIQNYINHKINSFYEMR